VLKIERKNSARKSQPLVHKKQTLFSYKRESRKCGAQEREMIRDICNIYRDNHEAKKKYMHLIIS
jgi:hypothetical protein